MNPLCSVPVEVIDELGPIEARAAFLAAAIGAIASLDDLNQGAWTHRNALLGLFYWTQDLEEMLRHVNELAQPA